MGRVYPQSLLEMWYCEQGEILGSERAFRRSQSGTKSGVSRAGGSLGEDGRSREDVGAASPVLIKTKLLQLPARLIRPVALMTSLLRIGGVGSRQRM